MPYILSLETSGQSCSVALHHQGKLVSSYEHHQNHGHSHVLPKLIEAICATENVDWEQIDAIAISQGPGSYTGLRVGTALAKGICYARHIPLLAINTLHIVAASIDCYPLPQDALRYILLDARKSHAYGMVSGTNGILRTIHTCQVTPAILDHLPSADVFFCGSGADNYQDQLLNLPRTFIIKNQYPQARYMGMLAWQKLQQNEVVDLHTFEPIYLNAFL